MSCFIPKYRLFKSIRCVEAEVPLLDVYLHISPL
jgi:hypothetical protein